MTPSKDIYCDGTCENTPTARSAMYRCLRRICCERRTRSTRIRAALAGTATSWRRTIKNGEIDR